MRAHTEMRKDALCDQDPREGGALGVGNFMNLRQRYRRLTFWNKLYVWGSVASIFSILSFVLPLIYHKSDQSRNELLKNVQPSRTPSVSESPPQAGARTEQPSQQTDPAIPKKQDMIRELASKQKPGPDLVCAYEGKPLSGQKIPFDQDVIRFEVKNVGDAAATNISFRFYTDLDARHSSGNSSLEEVYQSDKSGYLFAYKVVYDSDWLTTPLNPTEPRSLHISKLKY